MILHAIFNTILLGIACLALHCSSLNLTHSNSLTYNPFNATILDHDNNDITSSFRILYFFNQQNDASPSPKITNITDRRRQPFAVTRLITLCPLMEQVFVSSRCNFKTSDPSSLQSLTITCRTYPPIPDVPSITTHVQGHCDQDEICVTTTSQTNLNGTTGVRVPTAACVLQSAFRQWSRPGAADAGIREAWGALLGLTSTVDVNAIVGAGGAGLEVESLAMESQGSNGRGARRRGKRCRDCVGLDWKGLPDGTESLKAEARLLTTGALAGAGVLWLAVMAG